MPEPLDREAYLRTVAQSVDLQPAEVGEVLEEIGDHLSDTSAGWREAGYSPDDAERRAIRSLGDPVELGRELGRARQRRRYLLNAVGGAIFHAFAFGLWSWLFLWLFLGVLGLLGGMLAMSVLQIAKVEYGNVLAGPIGSLMTVAITWLWLAWFGWVLPARVARSAHRSVRGVQLAVGLVGFGVSTVVLWTVMHLTLDWVLAVGLPLAPFAFLLGALHPSRETLVFPRTTFRFRAAMALSIVLGVGVIGVVTAGPAHHGGYFQANTTVLGATYSDDPAVSGIPLSITTEGFSSASISIWDSTQRAEFARRLPAISIEIWPATLDGETLVIGHAPLATASAAVSVANDSTDVSVPMPVYRQPMSVATVLVGVAPDGKRVILSGPDYEEQTPPWYGTLLEWWFGPR